MKKNQNCSCCGKNRKGAGLEVIDDSPVCTKCLYGDASPLAIYPIGVIRNRLKRAMGFGTVGSDKTSRIELNDLQKPFLYKLDEEKYITVIYYLHEARKIRSVFERGLDGKKVGIFASRTPDRPSRIAVQDVRLLKVEGATLYVQGLDAINGSPVLDIKLCWSAFGGKRK